MTLARGWAGRDAMPPRSRGVAWGRVEAVLEGGAGAAPQLRGASGAGSAVGGGPAATAEETVRGCMSVWIIMRSCRQVSLGVCLCPCTHAFMLVRPCVLADNSVHVGDAWRDCMIGEHICQDLLGDSCDVWLFCWSPWVSFRGFRVYRYISLDLSLSRSL